MRSTRQATMGDTIINAGAFEEGKFALITVKKNDVGTSRDQKLWQYEGVEFLTVPGTQDEESSEGEEVHDNEGNLDVFA